jgi:DNA-binding FrmR family transcriptional regulator
MAHASDPEVRRGLAQARGHIDSIMTMLTDSRSCVDLAQQLQAVENTIRKVKRALVHDHMEHCIADAAAEGGITAEQALREFKTLTKYL